MADEAIFDETQRLHENMIVRVVVPVSSLVAVFAVGTVMVSQGAWAPGLAWLLGVGFGVPLLLAVLPQRTVVTAGELRVRSLVGWGVKVPAGDIVSARAVRYNPIGDCGGWGLRKSKKHGTVLNVSGDRGVHVLYVAGGKAGVTEKSMLIGSRRSEELAQALRVAAGLADDTPEHGLAPGAG